MPTPIKMPALSPTMEEGTLAKWLVKAGDTVAAGDLLAEIETDKATMEFEAVDEGTIASIEIDEGTEGVAVGTVIAMLAADGESVDDAAKAAPGDKPEAKKDEAKADTSESKTSEAPAEPAKAQPRESRRKRRLRQRMTGSASSLRRSRAASPTRRVSTSATSRAAARTVAS